ncbi:hypothetical protein [Roseobacter sp. HKCCA0434]|uniref:hypothetical protein n=1 Tax=Roseobacter sp. HKCCA0434 TaxID=3079297 RepID=UPI0029059477|nr:hypothetical protein [Roseobacter sp. HKCCA0434]
MFVPKQTTALAIAALLALPLTGQAFAQDEIEDCDPTVAQCADVDNNDNDADTIDDDENEADVDGDDDEGESDDNDADET